MPILHNRNTSIRRIFTGVFMYSLGINIGSSNVKAALLESPRVAWSAAEPPEGNFSDTLNMLISGCDLPPGVQTLIIGTEAR